MDEGKSKQRKRIHPLSGDNSAIRTTPRRVFARLLLATQCRCFAN